MSGFPPRTGGFILPLMDSNACAPGEVWGDALRECIAECDLIIIMWSTNAKVSKALNREVALCVDSGKCIVPVMLDDASLPLSLARRQAIDLSRLRLLRRRASIGRWFDDADCDPEDSNCGQSEDEIALMRSVMQEFVVPLLALGSSIRNGVPRPG